MPRKPRYLTATAAAAELDVTLPTLYAYVSRGLVRSEPGTGTSRARRYHADDVDRLKQRKAQRHDPEQAARRALNLGAPLLESSITLLEDGRFYYRGHDAVELARTRTLEEVAGLVWTGTLGAVPPSPASATLPPDAGRFDPDHPAESFQHLLARAAMADPHAYDRRPDAVARTGAGVLRLLAASVGGGAADASVARALADAWNVADPEAVRLIDAAMILCVDHELSVSSFTARCAASAHCSVHAAVSAGLSALGGARQSGGEVERLEALLDEAARGDVRAVLASRLRRGEPVPGFGHALYPDGDPRGAALLRMVAAARPGSPALALSLRVADAVLELLGEHPVVDLGLVTLARALGLPRRSGWVLFALGRTVGFVGHAIEQYASGSVVRPRARYTGPRPLGDVHAEAAKEGGLTQSYQS